MAVNPVGVPNTRTVLPGAMEAEAASTTTGTAAVTTAAGNMSGVQDGAPATGSAQPAPTFDRPVIAPPSDSLAALLKGSDASTLVMILSEASGRSYNAQMDQLTSNIQSGKSQIQAKTQARLDQITQAMQKERESQNVGFWGKLFGWVSKALSYVAQIASVVIGAAMVATGVGAPLGVAMLAFGVYSMIGTVGQIINEFLPADQQLPPFTLGGAVGAIAKAFGASEETVGYLTAAIDTAVAIAGVIAAFVPRGATALVGLGNKLLNSGMGQKVSNGLKSMTNTLGGVSNAAVKAGTVTTGVASVGSGLSSVGSAVANGVAAGLKLDASNMMADAKLISALLTKIQARQQEDMNLLEQVMQYLQTGYEQASKAVTGTLQAQASIVADMSGGGRVSA